MTIGDAFPLAGLRVIEIGHFIAAPFATRLLADLGADVIKIEPREGDPVRTWGEQIDGNSLWWSVHGRNKRSITLNLKEPRAKEIVKRLVREADAVVENFRPGQLDKLGLGPDVLRAEKPDLIVTHISGYGQTGPYRDRAAFGVIGEAIGGIRYLSDQPPGVSDLPPVRVGVSIGDSLAGIYAAFGLVAALWQRDRKGGDGLGRTIDVALTESVLSVMEGTLPEYGRLGKIRQPAGGGIATAAPTNAYPASDGGFVLIAANSEPLFAKLMTLMGRPELIGVPRFTGNQQRVANTLELDELIRGWSRQHDSETLIRLLKEADIPSSKVYTAADIAADPQYRERGMVREVADATFDQPVLHPGIVPHFAGEPAAIRWPGPAVGAHNDEVLQGLLGMSAGEVAELREQGVI
jgi:crotonobetainyl-CoA:carnitine CoA-transferase CaiB-like acyl-CoA transferase